MGCCGQTQTIDDINKVNIIQPQQQVIKEVPNTIQSQQQQQQTTLYRNDYCYDANEIKKIEQICMQRPFQNNDVIYYKANILINKDYTYYNEYYTIRTMKQKGLEYKSFIKLASASVQGNIESFTLKINNKILLENKEHIYMPKNRGLVPYSNYELKPEDNNLVTFEIEAKVKTDIYLGITDVIYRYINCFSKYNIKSSNDFEYTTVTTKKDIVNDFRIVSPQEIFLAGDKDDFCLYFAFKLKEFNFNLTQKYKEIKAFYPYPESTIEVLDKVINTVKFKPCIPNVIAIKDIYNIIENRIYAKTYVTIAMPDNTEKGIKHEYPHYILEYDNLRLNSIKCDNIAMDEREMNLRNFYIKNSMVGDYIIEPGQYFCTLEFDYFFTLRPNNLSKGEFIHQLYPDNLSIGGYYELCINYRDEDFVGYVFRKEANLVEDPNYRIKFIDIFSFEAKSLDKDFYNYIMFYRNDN